MDRWTSPGQKWPDALISPCFFLGVLRQFVTTEFSSGKKLNLFSSYKILDYIFRFHLHLKYGSTSLFWPIAQIGKVEVSQSHSLKKRRYWALYRFKNSAQFSESVKLITVTDHISIQKFSNTTPLCQCYFSTTIPHTAK